MINYKNSYGTKEQYINQLIDRITFWAKALANASTTSQIMGYTDMLQNQQQMLVNEGYTWEQVEQIEIAAYQK